MIGFDRPLRPQWIYQTLLLAEPGQNLTELNKPFEHIAKELIGKEGKRKARTVLFRCFLKENKKSKRVKEHLKLKKLSKKYGLDFMTPLYLFYLIAKTETLWRISEHMLRLYSFGDEINTRFIKQKLTDSYGDRDVVKRSVSAFIKTLANFGVVDSDSKKIILKHRLSLDERQIIELLRLFSSDIIQSPQLSLNNLPEPLFAYFKMPNLMSIAQKYNGELWEYHQRINDHILVIFNN